VFFALVIWLRLTLFAALIGFSCGIAFFSIYHDTHKKEEKIKAAILRKESS
jgi:cytochrome bd-type quinol oxidase subunit 2